jgi:putative NADH-flavin reductase
MKIAVFGTGFVGSAIIAELSRRGHAVTAVSRAGQGGGVAAGDAHDPASVAGIAENTDVLVAALPAMDDQGGLADAVRTLLAGAAAGANHARLGVVGGSAVLPLVEGGAILGDSPQFPAALRPRVAAHQEALDVLEQDSQVDWFAIIPAADFGPHVPGTRHGSYRTSRTALVSDAEGRSHIGVEDYAIAFADQIETPTVHRSWLTVGY